MHQFNSDMDQSSARLDAILAQLNQQGAANTPSTFGAADSGPSGGWSDLHDATYNPSSGFYEFSDPSSTAEPASAPAGGWSDLHDASAPGSFIEEF